MVYRRFHFSGDWSIGRLRLLRPGGSGDYLLARGNERTSRAQMGLQPLELSRNGKVLLACAAAEFHCAPVVFLVPRGVGASFDAAIRRLARAGELADAADKWRVRASAGSRVLGRTPPSLGLLVLVQSLISLACADGTEPVLAPRPRRLP
jgi:hypothetical protein